MDKSIEKRITEFLRMRIATQIDPRTFGKELLYDKAGLWCYRIGDYRIIVRIQDKELMVLVVNIGHRKEVYD